MPLSKKEFAALVREVGPDRAVEEARKREPHIGPSRAGERFTNALRQRVSDFTEGLAHLPESIRTLIEPETLRAIGADIGQNPLSRRPGDVINATVLPYREPVAQLKDGNVAGALGSLAPDALAALVTLAGPKVLSAVREGSIARNLPLPPALSDEEMVAAAQRALERGPGATINRYHGDLAGARRYAVGKFPERNVRIPEETFDPSSDVRKFLEANRDLLADPEHSLGVWRMAGQPVDLDVSGTPASLKEALRIGQEKGQEGVYDLKFANRKIPENGNIAVSRHLPPWLNALLGQQGELDLPASKALQDVKNGRVPRSKAPMPSDRRMEELLSKFGGRPRTEGGAAGAVGGAPATPGPQPEISPRANPPSNPVSARGVPSSPGGSPSAPSYTPDEIWEMIEAGYLQHPEDVRMLTGTQRDPSIEAGAKVNAWLDALRADEVAKGITEPIAGEPAYMHYSPKDNLTVVDPAFAGTGFEGAERERRLAYPKQYTPVSYFMEAGKQPEPQFRGLHQYAAYLPKGNPGEFYDMDADPLQLIAHSQELARGDNRLAASLAVRMAKDRGYKGYFSKVVPGAVAYFDKVPVTKVK